MTKNRAEKSLRVKEKEFDIALLRFNKWWKKVKDEVRLDFNGMLNWLLFYKAKDNFDKTCHVIEVVCFYIVLQYAWRGMFI